MPQLFPTHYTITSVTYNNVTAGSNVSASHPTALLVLTPDPGYVLDANDFSIEGGLPMGISSIVFTQAGANVNCTATFSSSLIMPSANVDIALCINGMGTLENFHVTGEIDPLPPNSNCTVDPEALYAFDVSGDFGDSVLVYDVLITADTGYYFPVPPTVVQVEGEQALFSSVTTNYNDLDGNLIGCMVSISCSIPSYNSFDNNFIIRASAEELYVPIVAITDYLVDTSIISEAGDVRTLTLIGGEGAEWNLTSNIPIFLTTEVDPVTSMYIIGDSLSGTMGPSGVFEITLIFPSQIVSTEYSVDLTGDLIDPFPRPIPILFQQLAEITLGFELAVQPRFDVEHVQDESRTYSALGFPPFGVGVAEVTNKWLLTSNDGGTLTIGRQPEISDINNWPIINKTVTAEIIESDVLPLNSVSGLLVNMDIVVPLQTVNNSIVSINTIDNEVTLSYPVSVGNGSTVGFSKNEGTSIGFGVSAEQISDTEIEVTETALISQFGYNDVTFTLDMPIRKVITNYVVSDDVISEDGETRNYVIHGDTGAVFSVSLSNGTTTTQLITNQVMSTSGEYTLPIVFPALPNKVLAADWVVTISGDLASYFNTPNNQTSAMTLLQRADVSLNISIFGQRVRDAVSQNAKVTNIPLRSFSPGDPGYSTHFTYELEEVIPLSLDLILLRQPLISDFIDLTPVSVTTTSAVVNDVYLEVDDVTGLKENQVISIMESFQPIDIVSIDEINNIVELSDPVTISNNTTVSFSYYADWDIEIDNLEASQPLSGGNVILEFDIIVNQVGSISVGSSIGTKAALRIDDFVIEDNGCTPTFATYQFYNNPAVFNETITVRSREFDNTYTYTNVALNDTINVDSVGYPILMPDPVAAFSAFPSFTACATP